MLKRLSTLALALLFVVGLTAQLVPHASAMPMGGKGAPAAPCEMERGDVADHGDHQPTDAPVKGKLPVVVNCLGCVAAVDMPVPPMMPALVEWVSTAYTAPSVALRGLAVEPEISPPILFV